jgi:hypothetical protein
MADRSRRAGLKSCGDLGEVISVRYAEARVRSLLQNKHAKGVVNCLPDLTARILSNEAPFAYPVFN